jgi:hypothetical protein
MVLVLLSTMILLVIIRYIQNVARSTFCDCFLSKYKQSSGKILLAVADCTHIKRKRSQRIDRATLDFSLNGNSKLGYEGLYI